jgi:hypothetical protein
MENLKYKCKHCGEEVEVEPLKVLILPHIGTDRLIKCPKCGKRHFMKKVK